jgi:cell division protein FtsW (lipid II flippase)
VASTRVFVDDAVNGDLPKLCARAGVPTDSVLRIDKPVGGLGAVWLLLLLLGPFGALAILGLLLFGAGRERLTVRIPYSRTADEQDRPWRSVRFVAGGVTVAALLMAMGNNWLLRNASLWVAMGAVVVALVSHSVLYFRRVDVELDGSRRWVTLSGVHPDFADAVDRQTALHRLSR